jgi:hypothetical protein
MLPPAIAVKLPDACIISTKKAGMIFRSLANRVVSLPSIGGLSPSADAPAGAVRLIGQPLAIGLALIAVPGRDRQRSCECGKSRHQQSPRVRANRLYQ